MDNQQQKEAENNASSSSDDKQRAKKGSQESGEGNSEQPHPEKSPEENTKKKIQERGPKRRKPEGRPEGSPEKKRTKSDRSGKKNTKKKIQETSMLRKSKQLNPEGKPEGSPEKKERRPTYRIAKRTVTSASRSTSFDKRTHRMKQRDLEAAFMALKSNKSSTKMAGVESSYRRMMHVFTATIYKATSEEKEAVANLIRELDYDSFTGYEKTGTIKSRRYGRTLVRVDIQGTFSPQGKNQKEKNERRYVNIQVQIGQRTVAGIIVLAGHFFGREKIRDALLKSMMDNVGMITLYKKKVP